MEISLLNMCTDFLKTNLSIKIEIHELIQKKSKQFILYMHCANEWKINKIMKRQKPYNKPIHRNGLSKNVKLNSTFLNIIKHSKPCKFIYSDRNLTNVLFLVRIKTKIGLSDINLISIKP